jgi:hypothetical protein
MRQGENEAQEGEASRQRPEDTVMRTQVPLQTPAGKFTNLRSSHALLRSFILASLIALFGIGLFAVIPVFALAETPAPGWAVFGSFYPTGLEPNGHSVLRLYLYDVGAAPGDGEALKLVDVLPEGLEAEPRAGCSGRVVVTCVVSEAPLAGTTPGKVEIPVRVVGVSSATMPVDRVSLSGGGALGPADAVVPAVFRDGAAGAGFANADVWITNSDGVVDTQAGSHPYELTMVFGANLEEFEGTEEPSGGEAQALNANLPPGLVGEPGAVPECSRKQFDAGSESGGGCPVDTMIGEDHAFIQASSGNFDVYNLVPPPGVAAEFGFDFDGTHTFLDARVRSGGDYGIAEHANVPQLAVIENTIVIWGVPGEHGTGAPVKPLLTLPTSCGEPPSFSVEMLGTWQNPNATAPVVSFRWHNSEDVPVGITGCERLTHFNPSISLSPETSYADTPTGLTTVVKIPQGLNPDGLATAGLKETTVVLPPGMAINPGQATGLVACQSGVGAGHDDVPVEGSGENGELERYDGPPECPAASKVGTDEIATPLLHNRLKGNVYILQSNPPNLQILVAAEGEGVYLKLLGNVHLNTQTGQLETVFKGTPQYPGTPDAPLNEFLLSFSGGAQAALVTPAVCSMYTSTGQYTSTADFTPWSSPFVAPFFMESGFSVDSGPGGTPCADPLPFSPTLTAGATTDQAGGFTDFSMLLQRPDGQQRIERLRFKTPPGLLGMISKVPLCPSAQAAAGTCPAASQIGHTVVGAGPGPYPLFIPEAGQPPAPIYLTEGTPPAEGSNQSGAPYGLSIVVPIHAGPFTLETQVVRASIEVDPHTAQLTIATAALPQIVDGIPTDLRSIDAVIDRPGFMFNPTDCNSMSFSGAAYGTPPPGGAQSSGASTEAPLSSHFKVEGCGALQFKPNFKVSTSAKTSKKDGASLTAKIVYPTTPLGANQASSQANIAAVKVDLPKQLPSRLTTLQKACTAAQFEANPAGCPAASLVGHATAVTPVLPVPLTGPAYFVSHGGEAFPSLIVVLQGYGVTIDLVGTTFISKAGITSSTFKQVPDVPISSFELTLPEGPNSALAANLPVKAKGSFCGQKLAMPTAFVGQNGAVIHQTTRIGVTACPKARPAKQGKHHKKSKRKTRRKGR